MRMKEEDLTKAIELKKELDSKRELLQFANREFVDINVCLEDNCSKESFIVTNYLLGDNVINELKAKVIASIEKSIYDLLDKLEKL